jgi:hypothetical protein
MLKRDKLKRRFNFLCPMTAQLSAITKEVEVGLELPYVKILTSEPYEVPNWGYADPAHLNIGLTLPAGLVPLELRVYSKHQDVIYPVQMDDETVGVFLERLRQESGRAVGADLSKSISSPQDGFGWLECILSSRGPKITIKNLRVKDQPNNRFEIYLDEMIEPHKFYERLFSG